MNHEKFNDLLLAKFEELISQFTGLKIREREKKRVASSIILRMNELRISDPLLYYQRLLLMNKQSQEEVLRLTCSFVNTESYFFRDKGHFETLKNEIFPTIIKAKSQQKQLRVWSAGCSGGEELYSIALLLFSFMPDWKSWKIILIGTDLCQDMVEKARRGVYGENAFRGMNLKDRERFFDQLPDGSWQIESFFRQMVIFERNNLFSDPFPNDQSFLNHMDLIICRNVFIYFQQDAITKVVDKFSRTLNKGGYLLTGHGELQNTSIPSLKSCLLKGALVYQKVSD